MRSIRWPIMIVLIATSVGANAQALVNGQFVTPYAYIDYNTAVANGWNHFRAYQSPQFKQSDSEQMPGGPGGQVSCQQIWADWSAFDAGVYQRISGCTVGQRYVATGWFLSICQHGISIPPETYQDGKILQKIGIDPTGGTDWNSSNIVWSWTDPLDRRWRELRVSALAQSTTVTVFARTQNTLALHNCLSFYDAFGFSAANPVSISNVSIRPNPNGATVAWTTDVASTSRVEYYQWQGFVKNPTVVSDSNSTAQHSITLSGLSPGTQYYYKLVSTASGRADGVVSGSTFYTPSATYFATLEQARNAADGVRIFVPDLVTTVGTSQSSQFFFVEQSDRVSGIRVDKGGVTANVGDKIDLAGVLSTVGGERKLTSATVYVVSSNNPVHPLAMSLGAVGGASGGIRDPGITVGTGPFNVGLLVTVWGRVTAADPTTNNKYFYVDDGSGLEDGLVAGRKGVRVSWYYMSGASASDVAVGDYVCLTGAVSCFQSGGKTYPQIFLRSRADIRVF